MRTTWLAERGRTIAIRSAWLVLCATLSPLAAADVECDEGVICIREVRDKDEIRLFAENHSEFPLTYTMRVKTRNMASRGPSKITRTLPAGKSEVAFELQPAGGAAPRYRYAYDWTVGDQNAVHDDDYVYLFPYEAGQSYRVIQSYGSRFSHTGLEQFAIDFRMSEGTPVHAARDGVVARIEERHAIGCWEDGCGRYANYVVILHDDGTTGEYYHLQKDGALVEVGERVHAGQKIALSGNTGHTTIPHLHFAVYRAVDWGNTQSVPVRFLSSDGIVDRPRRGGRYEATSLRRFTATQPARAQALNLPAGE
jgi:murein DD-endopeptidase MepM/ murein hydrolase activator NlpD